MSTSSSKAYITPEQYEEIEEQSEIRHEYYRGEMFAMAGATVPHILISGNIARALGNHFEDRPCTVYQSDLRVRINATGLYTYPDIVAVCGPAHFAKAEKQTTLVNPILLVEVFSPSTEAYDRGKKLDHYKTIESLQEIVLVAQDQVLVHHFRRLEGQDAWLWTTLDKRDAILPLDSIACEIPLSRIYARTDAPEVPLRSAVVEED